MQKPLFHEKTTAVTTERINEKKFALSKSVYVELETTEGIKRPISWQLPQAPSRFLKTHKFHESS